MQLKTKPYEYQLHGAELIDDRFDGRCLLADPMGAGKSLTSLLWLLNNSYARPAVVVCPASVKHNWQREASMHVGMNSYIMSTTRPLKPSPENLAMMPELVIINYTILKPWMSFLKALKPQVVLIDEAQACGNSSTRQTRMVKQLCKGVPFVIAMSGTPLTNNPIELYPILNILRPDVFHSRVEFGFAWCNPVRMPFGWSFQGASNLDRLNRILHDTCMIRRSKQVILKELPPKRRHVVLVDIDDRASYEEAERDLIKFLLKIDAKKARRALRAERLVRVGYLKRLAAQLKLRQVLEWLSTFLNERNDKLLVFGVHKNILGPIYHHFKSVSVKVDGSVASDERQKEFDAFKNNKHRRLFIGNIRAAGSGWNGTAAHTVAFAEMDWTPGAHVQAEDRTHRLGQVYPCDIYYLIARHTIEHKLARVIQRKQRILDTTLDAKQPLSQERDNVFDLLCQALVEER